jgi:hypothetical protein
MAINFRSIISDPKIEIVGDEVPLAAFEKASNILNQRYAQSAEAATRAQEALNQQLQVSDEREKEALKAYYDDTYGQLKNIATSDDYLDQEWKTKSLGLRTAANLKVAEDRAKIANQQREQLRLAKNISDPEIRKMYEDEYNQQFAQTKYDPNTGLINFGTLNAPRIVEDRSIPQELNKALAGFAADVIGTSWDNVKIINKGEMIPGTNTPAIATLAYDLKGKQVIEKVKEEDLKRAAKDYIASDPDTQAYLNRQIKFLKYKNPNLTDNQALQIIDKTIVEPAISFTENKYGYNRKQVDTDQTLNSGLTGALNAGYGQPPQQPFSPWDNIPIDITKEPIEPLIEEQKEIASTAFDKNENFKEVPQTTLEKLAKTWSRLTGMEGIADVYKMPNASDFNTLVPQWKQDIFKVQNPKITPKQMYEQFMNEKINYRKRIVEGYSLAFSDERKVLNENLKYWASAQPLYNAKTMEEITDIKEKQEILNQGAMYVPANGQLRFGKDYISGLGVVNPNAEQLGATQQILRATSKMINAALNPEVYNDTTGDQPLTISVGGEPRRVRLRSMKTNVGKKVLQGNRRLQLPTNIQVVDEETGQVINQYRVDDSEQGKQGLNNFIYKMLNDAALKNTL